MTQEKIKNLILDRLAAESEKLTDWHVEKFGIPYRPTLWMGRQLSVAERKAWSRAVDALVRDGLVERVDDFGRTKALKLTGDNE